MPRTAAKPPATKVEPVEETLHGVAITDRYRWRRRVRRRVARGRDAEQEAERLRRFHRGGRVVDREPVHRGRFRYSAVLGDASRDAFQATAERYRRQGFTDFKVKLSGNLERDLEKISLFQRSDSDRLRVRVDANNLWKSADDAIRFLRALEYSLFAVEEPIQPDRYTELASIAEALDCKIVLDESLLRIGQLAHLADSPPHWLINLRVSKMGGLLRSLSILEEGRALGIGFIIGAQVGETSLLTRAGLAVAAAARERLVAQEGAFGTFLLERDVCDPPLMFGAGGVLDVSSHPSLTEPGLTGTTGTIRTQDLCANPLRRPAHQS